jgi:hypothetical protein
MGRPPIGERALTAAEKMRRYRARKFGNKPPVTKSSATNAAVASLQTRLREVETELARERQAHKETRAKFGNTGAVTKSLERDRDLYKQKAEKAEARVAELEATLAAQPPAAGRVRPPPLPQTLEEWGELKRKTAEGRRAERAARRADPEVKIAELEEQLKQRDRRIAKMESESAPQQEIASLRKQLRLARSSLREVTRSPKGTVFVDKADLRRIRACLHPDRASTPMEREQAEAASKAFNTLPIAAV